MAEFQGENPDPKKSKIEISGDAEFESERNDYKKELAEFTAESRKFLEELIDGAMQSTPLKNRLEITRLKRFFDPEKKETEKNRRALMKAIGHYAVDHAKPPQEILDAMYGKNKIVFEVDKISEGEPMLVSFANMGVRQDIIDRWHEEISGPHEKSARYGFYVSSLVLPSPEMRDWAKELERQLGSLHVLTSDDFDRFVDLYNDVPQQIQNFRKLGIPLRPPREDIEPRFGRLGHILPLESLSEADMKYLEELKTLGVNFDYDPNSYTNNMHTLREGLPNWSYSGGEKWPPIIFIRKIQDAGLDISSNLHQAFELYAKLNNPYNRFAEDLHDICETLKATKKVGFDWQKIDTDFLLNATPFGVRLWNSILLKMANKPEKLIALKSRGGREEDLNLLLRNVSHRNMQQLWRTPGGMAAMERDFDFFGFLSDPAMPHILGSMRFLEDTQKGKEMPLFVGRYLFNQNQDPTLETVRSALTVIEQLISERRNVAVLEKGRGVTVIANDEKLLYWDGHAEYRFGKPKMVAKMDEVTGKKTEVLRLAEDENNDPEKLTAMKERILKAIEETPPPHTFLFNGHGSANGFWMTDIPIDPRLALQTINHRYIHYDEFVRALQKRYEKFQAEPDKLERDVFYFGACINHNLIRTIDEKLTAPYRPVFITSGEYAQVSYSDFESDMGNFIYDEVFQFKNKTPESVTVGDFVDYQKRDDRMAGSVSNISVFVPYKGRATQIAKKKTAKSEKKAA